MSAEVESLDQGRVDALIWKHAGVRPVREIAEMAGVRPDEVLRRKNELLEEVDVLTIQQKRQKLLIELDGIARDARKRAEEIGRASCRERGESAVGAGGLERETIRGQREEREEKET